MKLFEQNNKVLLSENRQYSEGDANFSFLLKRSNRRRTLSIVITEIGDIRVSVPLHTSEERVRKFISERQDWILKGLSWADKNKNILQKKDYSDGKEFLFLGQKYPLEIKPKDIPRSCIVFDGIKWLVCVAPADAAEDPKALVKKLLAKWYRKEGEEILRERTSNYAGIMKLEPKKVAVRSLKRIWGNCDFNTRAITYNWQVIQCPMEVVDYVVVHELCHLLVPNHSRRFWKKVEQVTPAYKKHVKWLKDNHLETVLP